MRFETIQIIKALPDEEAKKGFDFEFWIRYDIGWYGFAIQAKKLDLASNRYKELRHYVDSQEEFQIDLLKTYSGAVGVSPLYAFYNHVSPSIEAQHWHCNFSYAQRLLGCSLVPLADVEPWHAPHQSRSFENLHQTQSALPWHCLFCPSMNTDDRDNGAPAHFLGELKPLENHPYPNMVPPDDTATGAFTRINEEIGLRSLKKFGIAPKNVVICEPGERA